MFGAHWAVAAGVVWFDSILLSSQYLGRVSLALLPGWIGFLPPRALQLDEAFRLLLAGPFKGEAADRKAQGVVVGPLAFWI